jgi:glycosyltransferase involved in cell wall biosynthesis
MIKIGNVRHKGLVSVIIPAYNASLFIKESIDSAISQAYSEKEIIVVDDGSTDKTTDILNAYGSKIIYFRKKNGGPGSARNVGIKMSRGKFIAFLDADDKWLPNKLSLQIEYFEQNPMVGVVFGVQEGGKGDPMNYGAFIENKMNAGWIFDELLKCNFVNTSTTIVKREIFDRVGLFDEDRKLISVEDINLWLRISRHYQFGFINRILGTKGFHGNSLTDNFEQMYIADIYNFRKLAMSFPEWKLNEKRSYSIGMGNYYYGFGDEYFDRRLYGKARKVLLRSAKYYPWKTKTWIRLVLSFLPPFLVNYLRDHKGRFGL